MVKAANEFVTKHFSTEAIFAYTMTVFRDYAEAQKINFSDFDRELIQEFGLSYHLIAVL